MKSTVRALPFLLLLFFSYGSIFADTGAGEGNPLSETPRPTGVLHPDFDFTGEDFGVRLEGLPERALSNPRRFLTLASSMLDLPRDYLRPVGPERPLPSDFVPRDTVPLDGLSEPLVTRESMELDRTAAEGLLRLVRAASRDGVELMISSAYRSWSYQDEVYRRHVRLFGEEAAAGMSRPPGASQHQLGTSVDFGTVDPGAHGSDPSDWRNWRFIGTGDEDWSWLSDHAGIFGWSLSYPPESGGNGGIIAEPWHWRWIGQEAVAMQREFFDGSQPALLGFWASNAAALETSLAARSAADEVIR